MSLMDHPAVIAAEEVVRYEFERRLLRSTWVRTMIRVEITREIRAQLEALRDRSQIVPGKQIGPIKVMGLSYYVVDHLPEPGWRIIGIPD